MGGDDAYIEKLNYMRDQLMECNKMWVFGVTPYFSILLSQKARDLYTYMMYNCSFVSEEDKNTFDYDKSKEYFGDIKLLVSQFEEYKRYITVQMETGTQDFNMVLKVLQVWIQCSEYLDYTARKWIESLADGLDDQLLAEKTEGEEIGIYNLLSKMYFRLGDYQKALELMNIKLRMAKQLFQPDSIEVAKAYEDMVHGYLQAENMQKATEYSRRALQIYRKLDKEHSLETIDLWNDIARLRQIEHQYDDAIEIYQKNIQTVIELSNESNHRLLVAYNNLGGGAYANKRQISKALKCYLKSQELGEKYYNGNASAKIGALNNIADIYHRMGDYDQAKKLLIKAKKICSHSFGEENRITARIYRNLAFVYRDLGQWNLAEKNLMKAIEAEKKVFGEIYAGLAESYMSLGIVCMRQNEKDGKLWDAYKYMLKSLKIRETLHQEVHGDVADSYSGLAQVCYITGDMKNALTYLNKAREINIKLFGKDSQKVSENEYNIKLVKTRMK